MKITRIYIKKYKNIQEQTLTFEGETSYLALIGLNGSGKSNWLEAISMIFRSLYSKDVTFTYEMDYEQGGQVFTVIHKPKSGGEGFTTTFRQDGKAAKRKDLVLPRVIACYSGESNRLWNKAYREYFGQFFRRAIQNKIDIPEMLYVNKYYWNIAFISLMCSDKPEVKDFLQRHFHVDNLADVTVTFGIERDNLAKFRSNSVTQLLNQLDRGEDNLTVTMSELASMEIDYRNNLDYCRKMFYYLFIAALPSQSEGTSVNKAISKIEVKVGGEEGINAYSFSEGEQKMILITCLTKLLADENTLLIFDEPDAHVHIANKKELAAAISSFKGQTILTSHSPIIIDDMQTDSIRYLDNGTVNQIDKISAVSRVSGNQISLIDGAFILSARKLVVTEGHNDINYIKTAVRKLGEDESSYLKLNNLAYVFLGSANKADEYFEKILKPIMEKMDKILFIFDYDLGGGWQKNGQKGYQEIEKLKEQYPGKLECIYYSNDYTQPASPFFIEDYFPADCYPDEKQKMEEMETPPTYRDLKKIKPVADCIKRTIENGYQGFAKDKYVAFKPLLNKVMEVFGMTV